MMSNEWGFSIVRGIKNIHNSDDDIIIIVVVDIVFSAVTV